MNGVLSIADHYGLTSLNTKVYERLKAMILHRRLRPGMRLVQRNLAREMGTSAMPVIEALRRLERDGYVIHVPHLGSFVKERTVEEVCEAFSIRRALELEACRLFMERADAQDRQVLRQLNEQMKGCARRADLAGYLEADLSFHMHLVRRAGESGLLRLVEKLQIEETCFGNAPELQEERGSIEHLGDCHDGIVDAIERGDADAAAHALREHLLQAEQEYRKTVQKLRLEAASGSAPSHPMPLI